MNSVPNKTNPFLSLVLSFRNEAEVFPEFIARSRKVFSKLRDEGKLSGWEFVCVNDFSTDRSLDVLLDLDRNHKDIKIMSMSRTFGVSVCVMAGFAKAKGDVVVYMDCDLQDPPELIADMLEAWRADENVDVVHTLRKKRYGESPLKLFVTKIGYFILNRYSSVSIPREAGDFKLLSRRVISHLIKMNEMRPFIRGLVAYVGFKQVFVSYERHARFAGKSKFFVLGKKVVSNFLNSALINFSSVPLEIASYCGFATILIDVALMIYTLLEKFQGHSVPGWTALMIVILFISAVQLFSLGAIGLYLNSVHEQSKMRPRYIVSATYGFENENT